MRQRGLDLQAAICSDQAIGRRSLVAVSDEADALNISIIDEGVGFPRLILHFVAAIRVDVGELLRRLAG